MERVIRSYLAETKLYRRYVFEIAASGFKKASCKYKRHDAFFSYGKERPMRETPGHMNMEENNILQEIVESITVVTAQLRPEDALPDSLLSHTRKVRPMR